MADPLDLLSAFDPFGSVPRAPAPDTRAYLLLDVFSDTPMQGNPLAVFTDGRGLSTAQMQRLARELNLSESVFFLPADGEGGLRIRIFTPAAELPFAGHPVLGSAIVAGAALALTDVTLQTQGGPVPVKVRRGPARAAFGRMEQPIPVWRAYPRAAELLEAIGVASSRLPVEVYDNGPNHVYVALDSEGAVAALRPDMRALAELGAVEANCFAGSGGRWKTRMFAPAVGVPEDPATGSAAGPLAVHLARHGAIEFGQEVEIRQGEEIGRPSLLLARADGSAERIERVEVAGSAVIVARGEFML